MGGHGQIGANKSARAATPRTPDNAETMNE